MVSLWLKRLVFTSQNIFKLETLVSLVSLIISVTCLIVSLTVMSSYETTLKKILIERTGHVMILNKEKGQSFKDFQDQIQNVLLRPYEATPFVSLEALALKDGKVRGVFLEGVDLKTVSKVLNLPQQIVEGTFIEKPHEALVGKRLVTELGLSVGSDFYISHTHSSDGSPQLKQLTLKGVVDLGQYDANSRYIITSLGSVQSLSRLNNQVNGIRIRMQGQELSEEEFFQLQKVFENKYWIQNWKSLHQNLFLAIQTEKFLIFFILLILVFVTGFHVSNQVFLDVLKRFRDIGILKTMGASSLLVVQLFLLQGIMMGVVGSLLGFILGILICYLLIDFYDIWSSYIPSESYQINQLILDFRWSDFLMVFTFSVFICVLNTLIPTFKSLVLTPKEGLVVE